VESLLKSNKSIVDAVDGRNKRTPLHKAAAKGNSEIAKVLVDNGANLNARDENGQTPLILAIARGQTPVVCFFTGVFTFVL